MNKRIVKIVILFFLIVIVIIGGYFIYKRIEYNKHTFSINIYDYVSPQAVEVFNVNKKYDLDEVFVYDSSFRNLLYYLDDYLSFPVIFSRSENGSRLLLLKVKHAEEDDIKKAITKYASTSYVKEREYKNIPILFYTTENDQYIMCSFYKGLLAISTDYMAITSFIDTDIENTFFNMERQNEPAISKVLSNEPLSLFYKLNDCCLALGYRATADTINLDGYILSINENVSDNNTIPYKIDLPEDICLDEFCMDTLSGILSVKIVLNKIGDTMLNK